MRLWIVSCSIMALLAPSLALANCPPKGCPAAPRQAAPARPAPQMARPAAPRPRGGGMVQRPSAPQQRTFGVAPSQPARQFGSSGGASNRSFGSQSSAPQGERHFGSASTETGGARHFGGAREEDRGEHASESRGFAHEGGAHGEVRRSESGHVYMYHGRSFARFEGPRYDFHGDRYHRYVVGRRLSRVYLLPDYYLDYDAYGLAPPDPGFEWIRYGPDILLVNLDDGSIVQVIYGAFDE